VERLEEEAAALFPGRRVLVLSSDLVVSVERLREEFSAITAGQIDIVIGTQLVAKGHHFPKLNLVGIIDADLGLGQGDPRAAERTFQLLHQVVGRAGREAGLGYALVQTHEPEHPVMRALIAGGRDAFYATEIAARERTGYPPFGRLASLVISGPDRLAAEAFARQLAATVPHQAAVRVLGPAEAPIAVIRGRHRFRLLAKSPRSFDLSGYLRQWLERAPKPQGGVRLDVDVDPQSFL
jgi:primosomal protein N' (replication factor Y)